MMQKITFTVKNENPLQQGSYYNIPVVRNNTTVYFILRKKIFPFILKKSISFFSLLRFPRFFWGGNPRECELDFV